MFGSPQLCALAFNTLTVSAYDLSEKMNKEYGWKVAPIHKPKAIHISVTPGNCTEFSSNFTKDLVKVMEELKAKPLEKQSEAAAFYGASATLPSKEMGDEMLRAIISATYK